MLGTRGPPEGLGWFEAQGRPGHLLLTNRHHDRDAWKRRDAFGRTVHCVRSGLHELEGRGPFEPFEFDELPGAVVADEVTRSARTSAPFTHPHSARSPAWTGSSARSTKDRCGSSPTSA